MRRQRPEAMHGPGAPNDTINPRYLMSNADESSTWPEDDRVPPGPAPSPATLDELKAWQNHSVAHEIATIGGPMFHSFPDRWLETPRYRCLNGHVSRVILKSEARGGDCCLACLEFVVLTFPEDTEQPREAPTAGREALQ